MGEWVFGAITYFLIDDVIHIVTPVERLGQQPLQM